MAKCFLPFAALAFVCTGVCAGAGALPGASAGAFAREASAQAVAPDARGAPPDLSLQQITALRCSAAFAIGARRQQLGRADPAWPPLAERGREFFVRASAKLMDDTGLDRQGVARLLQRQAAQLARPGVLERAMPPCLLVLDSTGL